MLTEIEFLDPENPRLLPLRLRRLFGRIQLDRMEYHLLRGIFSRVKPSQAANGKKHHRTRRINPMLNSLKKIYRLYSREILLHEIHSKYTLTQVYTLYFCIGLHMNCGKRLQKYRPFCFVI